MAFLTVLFRIARPIVIFLTLLAFIAAYTDYAVINVLVSKGSLYTLMLGLYHVSATASGSQTAAVNLNIFAAFSILMGLPIVTLYIVFQKYLTQMYSVSGIR
jgi:arabinogalactan oligomer/maltooligosaccharide transport system permease protein